MSRIFGALVSIGLSALSAGPVSAHQGSRSPVEARNLKLALEAQDKSASKPVTRLVDGDITLFLYPDALQPDWRDASKQIQWLRLDLQRWSAGKRSDHWTRASIDARQAVPLVKARTPLEERNLQLAIRFWRDAVEPIAIDRYKDFVAKDYVEHDAGLPQGGLAAMVESDKRAKEMFPNGYGVNPFVMTLVDGDLVALVMLAGGHDDGTERRLAAHVFRVADGKLQEHWGDVRSAP